MLKKIIYGHGTELVFIPAGINLAVQPQSSATVSEVFNNPNHPPLTRQIITINNGELYTLVASNSDRLIQINAIAGTCRYELNYSPALVNIPMPVVDYELYYVPLRYGQAFDGLDPKFSTGVIRFAIRIPEYYDHNFLDNQPFLQLRLYNSSSRKYKGYKRGKRKGKITSPSNPAGFVLGFNNRSFSSTQLFTTQPTQILLTQGLPVVYDIGKNEWVINTNLGEWDAENNIPELTDGSGIKGSYYVVSKAGQTELNDNDRWDVGDIVYCLLDNTIGQVRWIRTGNNKKEQHWTYFDFNPHQYFGASGNTPFVFPVRVNDWNSDGTRYRNRLNTHGSSAYYHQQRMAQNGDRIPARAKSVVVGFAFGAKDPNSDKDVKLGDDSLFFKIKPKLGKENDDTSRNFYYAWQVELAK